VILLFYFFIIIFFNTLNIIQDNFAHYTLFALATLITFRAVTL